MREIKFEAWDKDNKRMIKWEELQYCSNFILAYGSGLRQYTGLKDKNGKEIFEGDIIKCHNMDLMNDVGKIYYKDNVASFVFSNKLACFGLVIFDVLENMEIIGNIYSNPELLEEK